MNITQLTNRAQEIRDKYDELNKKENKIWGPLEIVAGFVGDMGDLTKLIMAKEGFRKIENDDEKLKHELADCLWSLLIIAKYYNIDLEKEFFQTMDELDERVEKLLQN